MKAATSRQSFVQWYGLRPLRERVMLLICVLVVLFFVWDSAVMNSIDLRKKEMRNKENKLRVEVAELTAQEVMLRARKDFDPDRENRQQLSQLQTETAAIEGRLKENIDNLVTPQEMPDLLKDLLVQQQKLQLLSLENLPAEALRIDGQPADEKMASSLYRHRLRLEFVGDYLATLAYLNKLENLPRQLVWEELEIETQEYPQAKVRLQVYTLSLSKGWIGG